ncbi:hypothetical protein [Burkholderia pseudomallei]|uniref:hypothetical protein n=1 Tax=Burkholderia pseudomallei TaxID=28450 RepID=UPI0003118A96|nr:hypothetical protein [Burkholderia pseudomallei]
MTALKSPAAPRALARAGPLTERRLERLARDRAELAAIRASPARERLRRPE